VEDSADSLVSSDNDLGALAGSVPDNRIISPASARDCSPENHKLPPADAGG
jgi:hypothetical protein